VVASDAKTPQRSLCQAPVSTYALQPPSTAAPNSAPGLRRCSPSIPLARLLKVTLPLLRRPPTGLGDDPSPESRIESPPCGTSPLRSPLPGRLTHPRTTEPLSLRSDTDRMPTLTKSPAISDPFALRTRLGDRSGLGAWCLSLLSPQRRAASIFCRRSPLRERWSVSSVLRRRSHSLRDAAASGADRQQLPSATCRDPLALLDLLLR